MSTSIDINNLCLTFETQTEPVHALSDINLQVNSGDFVSLIGPSGCGKTTLLRVIADLEKPTSGTITVEGKSPHEARVDRSYGYVFQTPALLPWRNIESNIHLPLEMSGYSKDEQKKLSQQYLSLVSLIGFEKKYPWQLSGGMQQRVSIARALSFNPDMLLMDEPFGALDEITRDRLNEELLHLWEKTQKTVVFVTHSIPEAVFLSSKIVVMSARPGKIINVIDTNFPKDRTFDIRESTEFLEVSQLVREGLKEGIVMEANRLFSMLIGGTIGPVVILVTAIIMIWYAGAVYLNSSFLIDRYEKNNIDWSFSELASDSWSMERPVLPSPHQIAKELKKTIWDKKITSPRSLVYHSGVTLSSAMVGFLMGTFLGIVLSVGIVYVAALDRTLMPWIIASQTIPILALAPMIVVVLGSMGIIGLVPKAMISTYLCFFPVVVGMVKGLRSPSIILVDLMNSYSASKAEVFWKLRLPASIPYLFASLKVAIALSVVGAIVAELPAGAQGGLGARLLSGSYYGQTSLIWAALITASVISATLVTIVGRMERAVNNRMGLQI